MPKKQMFTNKEVLERALNNIKNKFNAFHKICGTVSEELKQLYDTRNLAPMAVLLINPDQNTQEERDAYYKQEVEKLLRAFQTDGASAGKLDSEAIKPYIKGMYDNILTDGEIDWDDQKQVESLLGTMLLDQATATVFDNFKKECFDLYPTAEDRFLLEAKCAKAHALYLEADIGLKETVFNVKDFIPLSSETVTSISTDIEICMGNLINDATLNGADTVVFDPLESDLMKQYFCNESFSVMNDGATYTDEKYGRDFFTSLSDTYRTASVEQLVVKALRTQTDFDFDGADLLMINGKPMSAILEERNLRGYQAVSAAGQILRDALTDGRSVVDLMRVGYHKDGTATFRHQEIKVDLDKLNRETWRDWKKSHNPIRRLLHNVGIWKIPPRYAGNEKRDRQQGQVKEQETFKKARSESEKRVVDLYNSIPPSKKASEKVEIRDILPKLKLQEAPAPDAIGLEEEVRAPRIDEEKADRERIVVNDAKTDFFGKDLQQALKNDPMRKTSVINK